MFYNSYKNDFIFITERDVNRFVKEVVGLGEKYLKFLIHKGKIYLPFEFSAYDASIDLLSELFLRSDKQFIKFHNHFRKFERSFLTHDNFRGYFDSFIFTVIQNNLTELYRENDPFTYKIMRALKDVIDRNDYIVSQMITDKYIHRKPLYFDKYCMDKDALLLFYQSICKSEKGNNTGFKLDTLFNELEKQSEFLSAVGFNDLVFVYKQIVVNDFKYFRANNAENSIQTSFLLEEIKIEFTATLKKYFIKVGFSEQSIRSMYNLINDVLESYKTGSKRKSIKKLTDEYFPNNEKDGYYDKVEYCIHLLNDKIIKTLKIEGIIERV